MRVARLLATVVATLVPATVTAAQPQKATIEFRSERIIGGLPMAESDKSIYAIHLTLELDKKGEGKGALELDPNVPKYDEFGFPTLSDGLPWAKLDCTVKFVKKKKTIMRSEPRLGSPEVEVEWSLFEIEGPKLKSRLFLARSEKTDAWVNLLIQDKQGKVRYVVSLGKFFAEPCHPGCFPAGTPILTPDGPKLIERLCEGDAVTTVGPDGAASPGKVVSVFVTTNRLIEVRTDAEILVTTETQPLALAGGGLRAAGELKAGDRIFRWDGRQRIVVTVQSVSPTRREEQVFNLILGDPAIFVADGFLVRSKPPAILTQTRVTAGSLPARARD